MGEEVPMSRMDFMLRKEALRGSPRPSLAETSDEDISVITEDTSSWKHHENVCFSPIHQKEKLFSENCRTFLSVLEKQLGSKQDIVADSKLQTISPSTDVPSSSCDASACTMPLQKMHERLENDDSRTKSESHVLVVPQVTSATPKLVSGTGAPYNPEHCSKYKKTKRHLKNFVLLLQPATKHFELIEIRYKTATATIGDLLKMIPQRSIIVELSTLSYTGFVYPKQGVELTDLSLMATGRDRSANLEHHDVLVAITKGYTGAQLAEFSKPILASSALPTKQYTSSKLAKAVSSIAMVASKTGKKEDPKVYQMNFVLLLQPRTKSFEFIEIRYEADEATTVADLLKMIPERATVLALGVQKYSGFFRPRDNAELSSLSLPVVATASKDGADIQNHEVLVAISEGYTGAQISEFCKPILANPNVVKLFAKSDPVALYCSSKTRSRLFDNKKESKNKNHKQLNKSQANEVQQVHNSNGAFKSVVKNRTWPEAVKVNAPSTRAHAKYHKPGQMSGANANMHAVPENSCSPQQMVILKSLDAHHMDGNPVHVEKDRDVPPPLIIADSREDCSISSGVSDPFGSTYCSNTEVVVVPTKKRISRRERAKRHAVLGKVAAIGVCYLMTRYLSDHTSPHVVSANDTLGFLGLGQFGVLFVGLVLIQRFQDQNIKSKMVFEDSI